MKPNHLFISIVLILCTLPVEAQKDKAKFKFGDIKAEDFMPSLYSIDSSAGAIYLFDVGSSEYRGNEKGYMSVVYQKKARIRLVNKNSFDNAATVIIYLNDANNAIDELEEFQAGTYNLENGKIIVTKSDKSAVFKEKERGYNVLKFTFPNIKEGSIIEYSYRVVSPFPYEINSWTFQEKYPKLWCDYTVSIPQFYNFVTFKQGYLPYEIDTVDSYKDDFLIFDGYALSFEATVYKHRWAIRNVPAIKQEPYLSTIKNYQSKISFQLSSIKYLNQPLRPILHDWNAMVDELMKDEHFGENLKHDLNWISDHLHAAGVGSSASLENAKRIYQYVQQIFTSTDGYGIFLSQSLKKTAETKKGNITDINMLLTAMLQKAGFEAYPALLSTREHGKVYDIYPIMSRFNYLIVQVKIDGKAYILDAADKNLGFGYLSEECYNGNARLVAPVPAVINLSPDSLKETSLTFVTLRNEGSNKISGAYSSQLGAMKSQALRRQLTKENKEDFFKNFSKTYSGNFSITNTGIDSLKIPEAPVNIRFDLATSFDADIVYFNPMMGEEEKENPFSSAERFYPVEMPGTIDKNYMLSMEIPAGYIVDELPKSVKVDFNDDEGFFEYLISKSAGSIQLQCHLQFNKATFEPEDYESLRDFYSFIVQKEGEQIVFKKSH